MKKFIMSSLLLVFSIGYTMEESMSPDLSYSFELPNQQLLEDKYNKKKEAYQLLVQSQFDKALRLWIGIIKELAAKLSQSGYLIPQNSEQEIDFIYYGFPAYTKIDILTTKEKEDKEKVISTLTKLTRLEVLYYLTLYLYEDAQNDPEKFKILKDVIRKYVPLNAREIEKITQKSGKPFQNIQNIRQQVQNLYNLQTKNLFILLPDKYKYMILEMKQELPPAE